MSATYTITYEATPRPNELAVVRAGLAAYNRAHTGDDTYQPLALLVRDAYGAVVGGLLGGTYWGWFHVDILWLVEQVRQQEFGSRLLKEAEQIARERGCHAVHLDTMSFQARSFYERHGYTVFGVLDDMPRGHQRYFLKKSWCRLLTMLHPYQPRVEPIRRNVRKCTSTGQ